MEQWNRDGGTVEHLIVEQSNMLSLNGGKSYVGRVEHLVVDQWNRNGGTMEHLMVEQYSI